jgi:prolipoprotein diacylglyceryltransferase
VEIKSVINDPGMLLDLRSGFVVYGGIALAPVAVWLYARKHKLSLLEYAATIISCPMRCSKVRLLKTESTQRV